MKPARGYCRVSTQSQVDNRTTLSIQKMKIEAYCQANNYQLLQIYIDMAVSAKNMDRPEFIKMMTKIASDETVIVTDLSRFSRNYEDGISMFSCLKRTNADLICLEPELRLSNDETIMKSLLMSNQMELERQSERASGSMNLLSEEGRLRSKPPFGYKFVDKQTDYEPVPEQLVVKDKIVRLHDSGLGFTRIAKALNEDGDNRVLSLNKKKVKDQKFYAQTVKRILIDYGLVDENSKKSIQERIISHYDANKQSLHSGSKSPSATMADDARSTASDSSPSFNEGVSISDSGEISVSTDVPFSTQKKYGEDIPTVSLSPTSASYDVSIDEQFCFG